MEINHSFPLAQASQGDQQEDQKKPRRSTRNSSLVPPANHQLPSPVTGDVSLTTGKSKETTVEPPASSQLHRGAKNTPNPHVTTPPPSSPVTSSVQLNSPPGDTQMFTQASVSRNFNTHEVEDEEGEGVWGYLIPIDQSFGDALVLRRRTACPMGQEKTESDGKSKVAKDEYKRQEERYEETKIKGAASGGYLVGRHPECGEYCFQPLRESSLHPKLVDFKHILPRQSSR